MERMTHERANGIKTGYWSPATKETLVQRLAAYENTGLEPWEIGPAIEKAAKDAKPRPRPRWPSASPAASRTRSKRSTEILMDFSKEAPDERLQDPHP